jgi:hypothetical protein
MKNRITIIILAFLVVSTSANALAECAWVLWTKPEDRMFDPQVSISDPKSFTLSTGFNPKVRRRAVFEFLVSKT